MAKILVIDDDLACCRALSDALSAVGHSVGIVQNAQSIVAQIQERSCDLVITDVLMPEFDGFDVIAAIRRAFPRMPIIAISGKDRCWLRSARLLGASRTLEKPFGKTDIATAVAEVLA